MGDSGRRYKPRRFAQVCVATLAVSAGACSTAGMAFKVDETIDIVAPEARSTVRLPVTVRWRDDEPRPGYFAVFVDRAPIRPGTDIAKVLENDAAAPAECPAAPLPCLDRTAMRDRGVVLTTEPATEFEFLTDLRPNDRGKDPHEVTVVRMMGERRVGEAAFRVSFFVDR